LRLSDRWASGVSADGALAAPDREMPEEPKRRQFSPEYRLRIPRGIRAYFRARNSKKEIEVLHREMKNHAEESKRKP